MANVTTVTFDYILVIVFLFPLNVGVSLCFHCTVLVPVCMFLKKVEYQEVGDEKRREGGGLIHLSALFKRAIQFQF